MQPLPDFIWLNEFNDISNLLDGCGLYYLGFVGWIYNFHDPRTLLSYWSTDNTFE